MNYNEIIGSNIRYERRKRGLTIDDFAKIIGIAPGFLGLIERGQKGTSIKNMVFIAKFFDITMDQLIKEDLSSDTKATEMTKLEKDKRALSSMIAVMSDEKIQILTANAKTLNEFY